MRRYTLNISDREFVIDVQEVDADQFEVVVGEETYAVTLAGDESLSEATITPGIPAGAPKAAAPRAKSAAPAPSAAPAAAPAAAAAPARKPAGGGGKGAVKAPMPGVILEVNVKPGDSVKRGQQVAILEAMKMHNVIGAPKDGVIGEVFVSAGESVDHGTPIVSLKED